MFCDMSSWTIMRYSEQNRPRRLNIRFKSQNTSCAKEKSAFGNRGSTIVLIIIYLISSM